MKWLIMITLMYTNGTVQQMPSKWTNFESLELCRAAIPSIVHSEGFRRDIEYLRQIQVETLQLECVEQK